MSNFSDSHAALIAFKDNTWKSLNPVLKLAWKQTKAILLDPANYWPQYKEQIKPCVGTLLKSFEFGLSVSANYDECFHMVKAVFLGGSEAFAGHEVYTSLMPEANKKLASFLATMDAVVNGVCDLENAIWESDFNDEEEKEQEEQRQIEKNIAQIEKDLKAIDRMEKKEKPAKKTGANAAIGPQPSGAQ